ncbi:prolyl oligopeptidase family serine peptidase [Metabacillus litoralis]|uniref:prolyl oligopeptidase family serine peptidase n=1 Tax=Metabacillus TaxID=2675233 RepID=UPI001B9BCFB2|nr:prolyl oligopeptidase family serine peptidase [Metabacillus litoralis]MCM3160926.1 prolyl oligopeptidase family serine peptidase [Metabacillus litoralis]MCM3411985.1 prolyl oligopeptidase family serine peptidase [Metabacillus litoralis]UHA60282.1 prolyl oligopeptidase family serine peptidase [Metabacillus litoralis]
MIIVEKLHIENIPALHIVKQSLQDTKTPFVIFVHGFTSAKENNLHYAYYLAEKGMRVILPEALYHGERSENYDTKELSLNFWKIVLNEIKEVDMIKEYFEQKQLIDSERIGLAGTSMGGITTLGALTQYEWIKAAVSLMGSPCYTTLLKGQLYSLQQSGVEVPLSNEEIEEQLTHLQPFDLSLQKEKLQNRPLLFWHGERDNVVPFAPTYQFYKEITPMYEAQPEKLRFIADPLADHKVSREGTLALVEWFERYL